MTNEEIVRDYTQAANKSKQIKILAFKNYSPLEELEAARRGGDSIEGT